MPTRGRIGTFGESSIPPAPVDQEEPEDKNLIDGSLLSLVTSARVEVPMTDSPCKLCNPAAIRMLAWIRLTPDYELGVGSTALSALP